MRECITYMPVHTIIRAGGRIVSKIASVALCRQFSQEVPENPGQTSVIKFIVNLFLHLSTSMKYLTLGWQGSKETIMKCLAIPSIPFHNPPQCDPPWTNAGMGCNLTVSGIVECDKSIMDRHTLQYGTVGAVQGVKDPILVARSLLQTQ